MSTKSAIRMQCRHILASGLRCGSPALKSEHFCYYHHTTRRPIPRPELDLRRGHQSTFALPNLEDRTAVQLALGEVLARIASHDIDTKRAGLLLYGLQIALSSLPKLAPQPIPARTPEPVDELIFDELEGPIAPIAEYQRATRDKSLEQILLEQWHRDGEEEAARRTAANIINLQAFAAEVTTEEDRNKFVILSEATLAPLNKSVILSVGRELHPRPESKDPEAAYLTSTDRTFPPHTVFTRTSNARPLSLCFSSVPSVPSVFASTSKSPHNPNPLKTLPKSSGTPPPHPLK